MDTKDQEKLNKKLCQAVEKNDVGAVNSCIEAGADVNHKGVRCGGLWFQCCESNFAEVAELLIDAGFDLGDEFGQDLLGNCGSRRNIEVAKVLLDAGVDPSYDNGDLPVLQYAVQRDDIPMAKMLLEYGADWNATSAGYLHTALNMCGSEEMLRLLLECPHLTVLFDQDHTGRGPLENAYFINNTVMIELLKEAQEWAVYKPPLSEETYDNPWRKEEERKANAVQMRRRMQKMKQSERKRLERMFAQKTKALGKTLVLASSEEQLKTEIEKIKQQLAQLKISRRSTKSTTQLKLESDVQVLKQELQETKGRLASAKTQNRKLMHNHEERVKALELQLRAVEKATLLQVETYDLTANRCGRVVVFANSKFTKLPQRVGVDNDIGLLRRTFSSIGFNVVMFHDLKEKDMEADLREIVRGTSPDRFSSLFVIFLSHGSSKGVLGVDEVPLPDSDVYNVLGQASNLHGVPKIVIMDACQGRQQVGSGATWSDNINSIDEADESIFSATRSAAGQATVQAAAGASSRSTKPKASTIGQDLMVIKPALPEHVSKSHPAKGSLFIQVLCEIISQQAEAKDFESIIKLVNQRMPEAATKEGFEACPSTRHNGLTKRFFLLPQSR